METSLQQLGWKHFFASQLSDLTETDYILARLFSIRRDQFILRSANDEYTITISGKLLLQDPSCVGDWFVLDSTGENIIKRLERFSLFKRLKPSRSLEFQLVGSNIDTVFIVSSCNDDFNLNRLERYLIFAQDAGAQPVIILTKKDLCEDPYIYADALKDLDNTLLFEIIDAHDQTSIKKLKPYLKTGQTVAFMGSSGVGKSTLVNLLLGEEVQKTGSIREDDKKGRHTTTVRSIHLMAEGGLLLDTPGIRELQLAMTEDDNIDDVFFDISSLKHQCKFRNCQHQSEPGCAIQAAIEDGSLDIRRFKSYQKLQSENQHLQETIQQRRKKGKDLAKLVKSAKHMKEMKED